MQSSKIDVNKSTDYKYQIHKKKGGGWACLRLGKIKCGAKALDFWVGCISFNFAKRWQNFGFVSRLILCWSVQMPLQITSGRLA